MESIQFMPVKILFVGDIIGKPGRQALSRELHRLVDRHTIDIVIANGENAAGGFGLTVFDMLRNIDFGCLHSKLIIIKCSKVY